MCMCWTSNQLPNGEADTGDSWDSEVLGVLNRGHRGRGRDEGRGRDGGSWIQVTTGLIRARELKLHCCCGCANQRVKVEKPKLDQEETTSSPGGGGERSGEREREKQRDSETTWASEEGESMRRTGILDAGGAEGC